MPDLQHVSNDRLERIEQDCRGIALQADAVAMYDAKRALEDVKREKYQRYQGYEK